MFDKFLLRDVSHPSQPFLDRVGVPFDRFFTRCDERFKAKFSSMRVFSRSVLSYRVLSDMKAQEVEANFPLVGGECVRPLRFTWFQFQSHAR